jgi:hypothetical protein
MSRNYANIITAIWRDPDFIGLTCAAQRLYLLLVTQPNISACGSLPLTIRRWAQLAQDTDPDDLRIALTELEKFRFVFTDEGTEELLVRSFTRHDNGYGNRKRKPVIVAAAMDIESLKLRAVLAAEFARLGLPSDGFSSSTPDPPDGDRPSDSRSTPTSDARVSTEIVKPVDNEFSQANRASDSHADRTSRFDRVVGCLGPYVDTSTLNPQPPTPGEPEPKGQGEGDDPESQLIGRIRTMRPEWSTKAIRRTLTDPGVLERPWHVIAEAMLLVAADPTSTAPGRLKHDGTWWAAAAVHARREPVALDPPCGACGINRQVELEDGRLARCPQCHPMREGTAA